MDPIFPIAKAGRLTDLGLGVDWSPSELRRQITRRARALADAGLGPGQFCLIAHSGTPFYFADLLAVWQAGACAVPLNPAATGYEFENIAAYLAPSLILAGPGQKGKITVSKIPVLDLDQDALEGESHLEAPPAKAENPALLLFTSGATARPKGVVHTFGSVRAKLSANRALLDPAAWERTLCVLPTHFVAGLLGGSLPALASGKRIFLHQNPGIKGAGQLGRLIDEHGITFLNSGPSFWRLVLKSSPPPGKDTLRHVAVCSALLPVGLWEAIMKWAGTREVSNRYGTTETGGWDTAHTPATGDPETGLVGRPVLGEAAVLDAGGKITRTGEGEILLKSPALMKGYLRQPRLTRAAFVKGWYRTGDYGAIDSQGKIRILGRTQNFINRAGIKVLPEEIDMLIEQFPGVEEACAFAIPDAASGETVGVALVLENGCKPELSRIRDWCSRRIRPECVPERWFFVPEIPRNERGKINRDRVRDFCVAKKFEQ